MHDVKSDKSSVRQRAGKKEESAKPAAAKEKKLSKEEAKAELEKVALELAKNHDKSEKADKSKKMVNKLNDAGMGKFNGSDLDARSIKENFPDVWEQAKNEVAGIGGGTEALESLLDTVE